MEINQSILSQEDLKKLEYLNNPKVLRIVEEYVNLLKPDKVTVVTDSQEDIDYVRYKSVEFGEESKLNLEGHTVHYDAFLTMANHDQARDKSNTRVLVPKGEYASPWINTIDRDEGLDEIMDILDGCMKDHCSSQE